MPENGSDCLICKKHHKNTNDKTTGENTLTMGKNERRRFVLDVLTDAGVPLKSVDVFRACKIKGATFERRTTKTLLAELVERGKVIKVDSQALNDGRLKEIDTEQRGHFIAASAAAKYGYRPD